MQASVITAHEDLCYEKNDFIKPSILFHFPI